MIYTLKGGFVYSNDKIIKTNVIIENNLIKELGEKEEGEIINVDGLYLAPAFMDPHVHMREPGLPSSEKPTVSNSSKLTSSSPFSSTPQIMVQVMDQNASLYLLL